MFGLRMSIAKFVDSLLNPASTSSTGMFATDDISLQAMATGAAVNADAQSVLHGTMADRARDQITELQRVDPNFSEVQFLAQASTLYGAALATETTMDIGGLAGIATPEFLATFQKRFDDLRQCGLQCAVSDIKLLSSTIMNLTLDATKQSILVRFVGTGVRASQDAVTHAAVDGSLTPQSFTEFATFVRPAGTTTTPTAAQGGDTHCPSCGAPTVAGAAKCPFCGTQLTGTGSDWLLDKLSASAYT